MFLLLFTSVVLVGCPLGKTFILQPEEPAADQLSPAIRTSRCQAESLQSVRKVILDSLNLQAEPHMSVPGMAAIRDQWKVAFKATSQSEPTQLNNAENQISSEYSSPANLTVLQCCKLASQVFIRDLGWDTWIIYPESFTYVQCSVCNPQVDQSIVHCGGDRLSASQVPCCEPTERNLTPLLYLDHTGSLVIASVPLTRKCGCRPGTGPQTPKP
ncbi:bone morphogenetic protein 5-like [Colossoma macropomum]|uniref:bone morphogenetic protein 5-like n=1 Tax=Colossoma macropomum TaxID=42526 RepID=UPI001863F68B|nr:bone morphogenetic protein 5-like [Colossoma macropomum]